MDPQLLVDPYIGLIHRLWIDPNIFWKLLVFSSFLMVRTYAVFVEGFPLRILACGRFYKNSRSALEIQLLLCPGIYNFMTSTCLASVVLGQPCRWEFWFTDTTLKFLITETLLWYYVAMIHTIDTTACCATEDIAVWKVFEIKTNT